MFSLIWTLVLSVRHETLQGVYSLLLTWYWRSSYNRCPEKLRTATGHLQQLLHALSAEYHWASGFLAHCFPASVTQEGRYLLYWGTCFRVGAYVYLCVNEYVCVCSWVRRPKIRDRRVFSLIDFFTDWGRVSCWTQSLHIWHSNIALRSRLSLLSAWNTGRVIPAGFLWECWELKLLSSFAYKYFSTEPPKPAPPHTHT